MEHTRTARKQLKRKLKEAIPDLPAELDDTKRNHCSKTSKRRKEDRCSRNERGITTTKPAEKGLTDTQASSKKSKKERSKEKKSEELQTTISRLPASTLVQNPVVPNDAIHSQNSKRDNRIGDKCSEGSEKPGARVHRFIVFVGNLPFSATKSSIQKHLAPVHPHSVRHLTRKDNPTKSRGCAFVEFDGYDDMKACLKTFHHSLFNDGISEARKINVELTAGGGGNKANRQAKIGHKNQKLKEERIRRIQGKGQTKLIKRGVNTEHNSVHPSRRALVPESHE